MTTGPDRREEDPPSRVVAEAVQAGDEAEALLPGGDVTDGVVRVGKTVRRPVGPHSRLVHHVLAHLDQVGFPGAPRFLGLDAKGREVLTFVAGEVAGRPWSAWVADEQRIASVARLVRSYDDAVAMLPLPGFCSGSSVTNCGGDAGLDRRARRVSRPHGRDSGERRVPRFGGRRAHRLR